MARKFPRFLITQELGNTKSKGPFIIHTIYPKYISKIHKDKQGYYWAEMLEFWEGTNPETEIPKVHAHLHDWLNANAHLISPSF